VNCHHKEGTERRKRKEKKWKCKKKTKINFHISNVQGE
jgi:hypothetical protein